MGKLSKKCNSLNSGAHFSGSWIGPSLDLVGKGSLVFSGVWQAMGLSSPWRIFVHLKFKASCPPSSNVFWSILQKKHSTGKTGGRERIEQYQNASRKFHTIHENAALGYSLVNERRKQREAIPEFARLDDNPSLMGTQKGGNMIKICTFANAPFPLEQKTVSCFPTSIWPLGS